jgi:hypothetical protein
VPTSRRFAPKVGALLALAFALGCGAKPGDPAALGPLERAILGESLEANKAEAVKRLRKIGAQYAVHLETPPMPVGVMAKNGEIGLSWRVAMLPMLGEDALFKEFKLDESWDSEHNKTLIPKMPEVFKLPGKDAGPGRTHIRAFTGPMAFVPTKYTVVNEQPKGKGGAMPLPKGPPSGPRDPFEYYRKHPGHVLTTNHLFIKDGTRHTFMAVEAAEPIEWTNPNELPFLDFPPHEPGGPPPGPLPKLGGGFPGGFHALMCCGEVHFFPDTLAESSIRKMIGKNDGQRLEADAEAVIAATEARRKAEGKR